MQKLGKLAVRPRPLPALTLAFVTSLISFCGLAGVSFWLHGCFFAVGLAVALARCCFPAPFASAARGRPWLAFPRLVRVLNGWSRWAARAVSMGGVRCSGFGACRDDAS